jgi:hypothetical protein
MPLRRLEGATDEAEAITNNLAPSLPAAGRGVSTLHERDSLTKRGSWDRPEAGRAAGPAGLAWGDRRARSPHPGRGQGVGVILPRRSEHSNDAVVPPGDGLLILEPTRRHGSRDIAGGRPVLDRRRDVPRPLSVARSPCRWRSALPPTDEGSLTPLFALGSLRPRARQAHGPQRRLHPKDPA